MATAAATQSSQSSPGKTVKITVTAANVNGGPDFTFAPSPRVGITSATSTTAYSITTANSNTDDSSGMEYGCLSTNTGYSQRQKTTVAGTATANGPGIATSETGLPGTGWNSIGGGGS